MFTPSNMRITADMIDRESVAEGENRLFQKLSREMEDLFQRLVDRRNSKGEQYLDRASCNQILTSGISNQCQNQAMKEITQSFETLHVTEQQQIPIAQSFETLHATQQQQGPMIDRTLEGEAIWINKSDNPGVHPGLVHTTHAVVGPSTLHHCFPPAQQY